MSAQALGASALATTPLPAVSSSTGVAPADSSPAQAFADALSSARRVEPSAHEVKDETDDAAGASVPPPAMGDGHDSPSDETQVSNSVPATPDPAGAPPAALALLLAQSALSSGRAQEAAPANVPGGTAVAGAVGATGRMVRAGVEAATAGLPPAAVPAPDEGGDAPPQAQAATSATAALDGAAVGAERIARGPHTPVPPAANAAQPLPAVAGSASNASMALRVDAGARAAGAAVPVAGRSSGAAKAFDASGQPSAAIDASSLAKQQTFTRGEMAAERFASPMPAQSLPSAGLAQVAPAEGAMGSFRERDARQPAAPEPTSSLGVPASGTSGVSTVQATAAAVPGGATEFSGALADQISWWLGQKTQGAELTVQGPAGASVSVSVQVQGNEAHVAFRSDQAQARQLIGDSLAQLEHLLGGSGLVLGQVSVGAGSTGSRGRFAPDGGGQVRELGAVPANAASVPEPAARAATHAARRGGVDVYA
jgi:flagellar hook-length control protein FliK